MNSNLSLVSVDESNDEWNKSPKESIIEALNFIEFPNGIIEAARYEDEAITTPEVRFEKWQDLPYEIALKIIGYMSTITRIKLGATSTFYRNIVKSLPITLGIRYIKLNCAGERDHHEGTELIWTYFDEDCMTSGHFLDTLSFEFDDGDRVTLGIISAPLDSATGDVFVWSTKSGKVKTCNVFCKDPRFLLIDIIRKYAEMSRTKIQNLHIRCKKMEDLKYRLLLEIPLYKKTILESCQPDSLKLEVLTRSYMDTCVFFTRTKILNRVYCSGCIPRFEHFLKCQSNDIRIEHVGCTPYEAVMFNRFLHIWATGKLRPSFHYFFFEHGTRRELSDDKLIEELLVEKIREPPVSLLESLKDCADETLYERSINNCKDAPQHWGQITKIRMFSNPDKIGYLVAKELSIIFVVPQIAKNESGKIEYKKVDMEFYVGKRSSIWD